MIHNRQLFTEEETARLFGMCTKTFRDRVVKSGQLDFILIGRSRFYDPADIEIWKQKVKKKWPSENAKAHRSTAMTLRSAVVDIEEVRAKKRGKRH